ncbi:MAG: hypothetical protein R3C32_10370 [Chloroflexota bacterium]
MTGNAGETATDTVTGSGTDDDGVALSDEDTAEVTFTDVRPTMTLSKTATPTSLDEPGGPVDFEIVVSNTSPEPITLTSLVDNQFGDLDGQGDCVVPQTIAASSSYTCVAPNLVTGDAGDVHVNQVSAAAEDDEGNLVTAQDTATVTIDDTVPTITVDKQVTPDTLPEPGGTVQIRVEVTNPSNEDVVVTSLTDSIHGSLSGQGTCGLPTTVIANGGTYVCSLDVAVTGEPGDVETDVVTVTGEDNEGNVVTDSDDASVTITDVLPAVHVDKQTVPSSRPEPGGDYDIVVTVRNDSAVDALTVTSLVDDPHGDLDGQAPAACPRPSPWAAATAARSLSRSWARPVTPSRTR